MAKMKAAQVREPGKLELVEIDIPTPGPNQVRIRVEACGVCHSDSLTVHRVFPTIQLPRTPGHEVAGVIDAVGAGVQPWKKGQRVGVGWHGGHCGYCTSCRKGDFVTCSNQQICGISYDGGYAEYMVAPPEALISIPDDLKAAEAGPLLCAGITVFNSLRNAGARPPDRVAVHGLGGLGHLAVQFSAKMGYETVAMARQVIQGWPSGTPMDSQDTLTFSALTGVRAMIEVMPLAQAAQAYERMMSGKARFRVVIAP